MPRSLWISLTAALLALSGCQNPASQAEGSASAPQGPAAPPPPPAPPPPRSPAAAGADDPCAVLTAADFEAVGLAKGNEKRESNMAAGGCTWSPVLGSGGFLHFEFLTPTGFEKRRERAGEKATTVSGLGDDAFVTKGLTGHIIHVKKGEKFFRIDGNARLTPEKLEPLARAVAARF